MTLIFFPVTVVTCYLTDKQWPLRIYLKLTGDLVALKKFEQQADDDGEVNREELMALMKRLREENPFATPEEIQNLAETELLKKAPKSQAFYRLQANSQMLGGGDLINRHQNEKKKEDLTKKKEGVGIRFEETEMACQEDVGTHHINVVCERYTSKCNASKPVLVDCGFHKWNFQILSSG